MKRGWCGGNVDQKDRDIGDNTMGKGIFGDPGLLGVVWLGCLGIQLLAHSGIGVPGWLSLLSFLGVVAPIVGLILTPLESLSA